MLVRHPKPRPESWKQYTESVKPRWALSFHALEWLWHWIAYFLDRWVFLEVLESLGTFSVLIAVIFYFSESGDRKKQKHYKAWQVINTAQGKGGSGGRIEALEQLNADRVLLVGIMAAGATLQRAHLTYRKVRSANTHSAHFSDIDLF